jgi:hypothetical protein
MFQENVTDYKNTGNREGDGPMKIIQINKILKITRSYSRKK